MPAEIVNLLDRLRKSDSPEPTDALFDTHPAALAARLGRRAIARMQSPTADVKHLARLAASYAAMVIADRESLEQLSTNGVTH